MILSFAITKYYDAIQSFDKEVIHSWLWNWFDLLFQEYVVEDVDGEMTGSDWAPPALPPEHVQQLKTLGLLWIQMVYVYHFQKNYKI